MSSTHAFQTFTLSSLVAKYPGGIRIPMIQRDYAQGRDSWENPRRRFLGALQDALSGSAPLHLDFIYGMERSEDGVAAFCPLDGQQRLTTLFLLHWYLAARDNRFGEFQEAFQTNSGDSRFTYQVRPGGRSFFHALVNHAPGYGGIRQIKPSTWIGEQAWFRTAWTRDPSVAGALNMLDAIAAVFTDQFVGYQRLVAGDRITFEVLDLAAAGLHDDLYLRMNARGRPLSPFETFKARYERHLKTAFPDKSGLSRCRTRTAADFSRAIDNQWLDFIWQRYGPKRADSDDTSSLDKAFMNLFRAVALVSLPSKGKTRVKDVDPVTSLQSEPDFDDFEREGWLSESFTTHLIHVLEACEGDQANGSLLLGKRWFEDGPLLDRVLRHDGAPILTDYLQFAACVRFLTRYGPLPGEPQLIRFREWMRVVRNLTLNTAVRADNFNSILGGLDRLIDECDDILQYLATAYKISGFSEQQIEEERCKARLIRANEAWWSRICDAENHGYFRGQIGFLLDFSGADPAANDHAAAQDRFDSYWKRAREMFGPSGLNSLPNHLWERALLSVGDFLLDHGGATRSFLTNERDSPVSWKRLLREPKDGRRAHLQTLWDRISGGEALETIAKKLPDEPWRQALCTTPSAWSYCRQRLIRFEERPPEGDGGGKPPRVFLLSSLRRSAAYVELYTYRFLIEQSLDDESHRDRFFPLRFKELKSHTGSEDDPHLSFDFSDHGKPIAFDLYCQYKDDEGFSLWTADKDLDPAFRELLAKSEFVKDTEFDCFVHRQQPADPLDGAGYLRSIADRLSRLA